VVAVCVLCSHLQFRTTFSTGTPDRMDFHEIVLAVVEVVHVASGLLHEHALYQLASCKTVALPDAWHGAQLLECPLEFLDEEIFGVAISAPPFIFRCEPSLSLIEQNDFHDELDTA